MTTTWNDIVTDTYYTTDLAYNISAANIETALDVIYGAGVATVTADTDFIIDFGLDIGESELTSDLTSLTGATDPALTETVAYAKSTLIGTNSGTKKCYTTITATVEDAITGLKLTLNETGEYIELDHSFATDDEIIINTQLRTITKNGADITDDLEMESTYFMLPVGTYTIIADTEDVYMKIEHRERWI